MKILILRFSAIGDIVLTSPVIRTLHNNFPDAEIHFFTKKAFADLVSYNPYISHVHLLEKDNLNVKIKELQKIDFDYVFDLHHNLRTFWIKLRLGKPTFSFEKQNWDRYLFTKWQKRDRKIRHVVDRYLDTCRRFEKKTGISFKYDEKGLDFFIPKKETQKTILVPDEFSISLAFSVVLGATHPTKKWLPAYFIQLLNDLNMPVLLLGGKSEVLEAEQIAAKLTCPFFNSVGKYSLIESATLMAETRFVLTHDTGFMHIAAALKMKIISLWGSTSPDLGFSPYKIENIALEMKNLSCHPCSKIGLSTCPKGHFRCMKDLLPDRVGECIKLEYVKAAKKGV